MNKLLVLGLSSGILSLGGVGFANANQINLGHSGVEIVNENDGITASKVIDSSSVPNTNKLTMYSVESGNKDGGYWIRGKKNIGGTPNVYSKYKHYKEKGRASVVNGVGDTDDGGWKSPGAYSTAYKKWTSAGVNKTYYDHKK